MRQNNTAQNWTQRCITQHRTGPSAIQYHTAQNQTQRCIIQHRTGPSALSHSTEPDTAMYHAAYNWTQCCITQCIIRFYAVSHSIESDPALYHKHRTGPSAVSHSTEPDPVMYHTEQSQIPHCITNGKVGFLTVLCCTVWSHKLQLSKIQNCITTRSIVSTYFVFLMTITCTIIKGHEKVALELNIYSDYVFVNGHNKFSQS